MFPACMTTSTAGMSFNSPPGTEIECVYDDEHYDEEECPNYYNVDCEPHQPLFNKHCKRGSQGSYINIQNFEGGETSSHQVNEYEN